MSAVNLPVKNGRKKNNYNVFKGIRKKWGKYEILTYFHFKLS